MPLGRPISAKDMLIREDLDWGQAASAFIAAKEAAEEAARVADEAKAKLVALTRHTSERGYGVSVCRYWKGRKNSQEEVRVTVLKMLTIFFWVVIIPVIAILVCAGWLWLLVRIVEGAIKN
jgi:hypothetical protein